MADGADCQITSEGTSRMAEHRFVIPEDIDVFAESERNASFSYFKPGRVLQDKKKQEPDPEVKLADTKTGENTGEMGDSVSTVHPGTTLFGNEFSNLQSDKYYTEETSKETKSLGVLLVNPRQRGNPLLKHIRNVPWEFEDMDPDYIISRRASALFLSMRYHNLFPNYIHERLSTLRKSFELLILLVQVDIIESSHTLKDLSVIAILADCTLMVCWSSEEAGNYLETYKMLENKSADLIKEKPLQDSFSQIVDCLTIVRSINRTDAAVLVSTFGTLANIFRASIADFAICPGIGPLKAKRLYEALRKPIINQKKNK